MNEQIRELIAQAGTDSSGKWLSLYHAETLANLIIDKCAELSMQGNDLRESPAYRIINYFGENE